MTFTYDLSSVDENLLNISRVRLELGDTQVGAGVRPDQSNLQDEEILLWLTEEDNDIQATVARAARALSKMWTIAAKSITVGPRSETYGEVAKEWAARASEATPLDATTYAVQIIPVDQKHNPYRYRPEEESEQ